MFFVHSHLPGPRKVFEHEAVRPSVQASSRDLRQVLMQ